MLSLPDSDRRSLPQVLKNQQRNWCKKWSIEHGIAILIVGLAQLILVASAPPCITDNISNDYDKYLP